MLHDEAGIGTALAELTELLLDLFQAVAMSSSVTDLVSAPSSTSWMIANSRAS